MKKLNATEQLAKAVEKYLTPAGTMEVNSRNRTNTYVGLSKALAKYKATLDQNSKADWPSKRRKNVWHVLIVYMILTAVKRLKNRSPRLFPNTHHE